MKLTPAIFLAVANVVAVVAFPAKAPVIVPLTVKFVVIRAFPTTCNLYPGSLVPIPTLPLLVENN